MIFSRCCQSVTCGISEMISEKELKNNGSFRIYMHTTCILITGMRIFCTTGIYALPYSKQNITCENVLQLGMLINTKLYAFCESP